MVNGYCAVIRRKKRWKANCRYGEKQIVKGYTSRANKYYEFKSNYTKDEVYAKLKEPNSNEYRF